MSRPLLATAVARGVDPADAFRAFDGGEGAFWLDGGAEAPSHVGSGTPVDARDLPRLREQHSRMVGGAGIALVGWLDYGLGAETVGIGARRGDERTAFLAVDEALRISPEGDAELLSDAPPAPARLAEIAARIEAAREATVNSDSDSDSDSDPEESDSDPEESDSDSEEPERHGTVRWADSDAQYRRMIARCHERIVEGDAYLLCLTTRVTVTDAAHPLRAYERLRRSNGTDRGGLLRIRDTWMLSGSPEEFLTVGEDGVVTSSPVKGTRPRGSTAEEDERMRAELATSPKERAENVMIVDLVRNDLGRVCEVGSVEVPRLLEVESLPRVHQLVSTVRGRLRTGSSAVDAIASCFPAGSMTGAPKRAAVRILDELESTPRGLYSGAFGFLGCDGSARLSMTIRTAIVRDGTAVIGTGGGITALSVPDEEVAEIHLKAGPVIDALGG